MIQNYIKPQLTIKQVLQTVEGAAAERMSALIVGPQFAVADGNTNVEKQVFNPDGDELTLEFTDETGKTWHPAVDDVELDASSISLYVEKVEANLSDAPINASVNRTNPLVLAFSENVRDTNGNDIYTSLRDRSVQLGDLVIVEPGGANAQTRQVVGFEPAQDTAPAIGSTVVSASNSKQFTVAGSDKFTHVAATTEDFAAAKISAVNLTGALDYFAGLGVSYELNGNRYYGLELTVSITTYNVAARTGTFSVTSRGGYVQSSAGVIAPLAGDKIRLTLTPGDAEFTIDIDEPSGSIVGEQVTLRLNPIKPVNFVSGLVASGSYTGTSDNSVFVRVKQAAADTDIATYEIFDNLGMFTPIEITRENGNTLSLPGGVTLTFNNISGAVTGDIFTIALSSAKASTTKFDKVVLNAPIVVPPSDDITVSASIQFRRQYTGYVDPSFVIAGPLFTVSGNSITYSPALSLYEPTRTAGFRHIPLVASVGRIYAHFRVLVRPAENEPVMLVTSPSEVTSLFGPAKLSNDLGFAVARAISGSQGKSVYVLRTAGYSATAFSTAISKVERNDLVYAIATITDDLDAIRAVADHCDAMSQPDIKNFRRCYFGTDVPREFPVVQFGPHGAPYLANISADRIVRFIGNDTPNLESLSIRENDFLLFAGQKYQVLRVISDTELQLKTGPGANVSVAVSIWKNDTAINSVEYVAKRSKSISSRRAVNVWCDKGVGFYGGQYVTVPSRFIAAEVAGLRSALVPWLGLTRTEIKTIVSAPLMFTKYSDAQLNVAAAAGTFIIAQELEGGSIFVRHQLTTEADQGVLYYEDSIGSNVDALSFRFKDILDPLIGRTNLTPDTIAVIRSRAFDILKTATQASTFSNVGPQILSFSDESGQLDSVTVIPHPTFKDRVIIRTKVEPPLPLNYQDVELEAVIGLTI